MRKYAALIAAACLASYLAGALNVARRVPEAERLARKAAGASMDLAEPIFDTGAAAKALLAKRLLTPERFAALEEGYKRFAFTVANVDKAHLIGTVRDKLAEAVRRGGTREAFAESVNAAFDAAGATRLNPFHLKTVFETNVMSAYSAANWDMLHHPDVAGLFPMFRFEAVMDDLTSPICRFYHGVTLPADDPFWAGRWPPLHHRCRSIITALDVEVAEGVPATPPGPNAPALGKGFGMAPGAEGHWAVANQLGSA